MDKKTIGLANKIDQTNLSEEQKAFIKGLDESIGESVMKFMTDEIKLDALQLEIKKATDVVAELAIKSGESVSQKSLDEFKEMTLKELVKFKAATEKAPDGTVNFKSLERQVYDQLKDFVSKEGDHDRLDLKKACKESAGYKKQIDLFFTKANTPVTTSGAANTAGVTIDPSFSSPARQESDLRMFSNVAPISTRSITYGEMFDISGDAGWTAEGTLKPSMTAKVREVTVSAGKVALAVTLTEETLADIPQLVAEIKAEIINRIGNEEERGILFGDGQDGEITGVFTNIPEYTLTSIKVASPNKFDAIIAAYTQVVSVSKMNYMPNIVRVNPIDLANMRLTKDSSGQYLFPAFSINGQLIDGLAVKASTSITQGQFFLGDFNYLNIRDYQALTITFGWVNDDFQKNQVTMIGEKRLIAYIKANRLTAFVKGYFSVIQEAIDGALVAVTGITLDANTAAITAAAGASHTKQLTATVAPSGATNKVVTWTSSVPAKATVSSTGLVTGVAAGETTIIASTDDGGFVALCVVTVS